MSRKYLIQAAGTLTLIFTLSTVAFAAEPTTGPPSIAPENTALIQATYPESPAPLEDKQSQPLTIDMTAPEMLSYPVTASESYVDPGTLTPPAPPEVASVGTETDQTNTTSTAVTLTSTGQKDATINQLTTSTKQVSTPTATKAATDVSSQTQAKVPPLVTTKIVKHSTKAGETLYVLAQNFVTTVKSIKVNNNLKSDFLSIGQLLSISSNAPESANYKTKLDAYKVKAKDTLFIIAKKYGTTATSIKATNALNSNALYIGQILQVPYVSSITNNDSVSTQNYTIQRGDTLYLLAQKSNCTETVLKSLNNLTSNALFAGAILKVPKGSTLAVSEVITMDRGALSFRYQASRSEELLLARIIYGESRGESYEGQVAVGAVVLNRTKRPDFPQTIGEVIYQQYEFSAVLDGQVNLTPDASAMRAAAEALQGADPTGGALFYWNPTKAPNNKFLNAKTIIKRIGAHVFAK